MKQHEKIMRDANRDSSQAFHYKGFIFPKYEGRLTDDEYKSKQVFYAFWFNRYLPKNAIIYHVDQWLQHGKIPQAA